MYVDFKTYLKKVKRNFQERRYEQDIHYRAVLFHQFGESFRLYCKQTKIPCDYEDIAYEVMLFEKRIERYRSV